MDDGFQGRARLLVGPSWAFAVDFLWPRDGLHGCIFFVFFSSFTWSFMWLLRLIQGECHNDAFLLSPAATCWFQLIGLFIYMSMAWMSFKLILYYDDETLSRTHELHREFEQLLCTVRSLLSASSKLIRALEDTLMEAFKLVSQTVCKQALQLLQMSPQKQRKAVAQKLQLLLPASRLADLPDTPPSVEEMVARCMGQLDTRTKALRGRLQGLEKVLRLEMEDFNGGGVWIEAAYDENGEKAIEVRGVRLPKASSALSWEEKAELIKAQDQFRFFFYRSSEADGEANFCFQPRLCFSLYNVAVCIYALCARDHEPEWGSPTYPRRFLAQVKIRSKLHEMLLTSIAFATCFFIFDMTTVLLAFSRRCAGVQELCGFFLARKSTGTLLSSVYVISTGFCCRHISRLDPVVVISSVIGRMRSACTDVKRFHGLVELHHDELLRGKQEFLKRMKSANEELEKVLEDLQSKPPEEHEALLRQWLLREPMDLQINGS